MCRRQTNRRRAALLSSRFTKEQVAREHTAWREKHLPLRNHGRCAKHVAFAGALVKLAVLCVPKFDNLLFNNLFQGYDRTGTGPGRPVRTTGPDGRTDLNIGPSGRFNVAMCERRARTVTFSGAWRRDAMAIASVRCRRLRIEPKHR